MEALGAIAGLRPVSCWRGASPETIAAAHHVRRTPSHEAECVDAEATETEKNTCARASGGVERVGSLGDKADGGLLLEVGRVIREEQSRFRQEMEQRQEESQRALAEQLQLGLTRVLESELRRLLSPSLRTTAAAALFAAANSAATDAPSEAAAAGASPSTTAPGMDKQARTLCRAATKSRVQLPDAAVAHVAFDIPASEARPSPGGRSWRSQNSPEGPMKLRWQDDDDDQGRLQGRTTSMCSPAPVSCGGADERDDCPEVPAGASVALWERGTNNSGTDYGLQSCHSDCTSKSEVIHKENERWKHRWQQNLKARLSRRLNMQGSMGSAQSLPVAGRVSGNFLKHLIHDKPSFAQDFVDSHAFQAVCCLIIAVNGVFVGIETDIATRNAAQIPAVDDPEWFDTTETTFAVLFLIEVMIRMGAKRLTYFIGASEWRWNCFDFLTLVVTIAERFVHIMSFEFDLTYTRLIRSFRMIRILRLIRVVRFFRELRLMVCSICSSIVSLSWALVLCSIIMYLFTICFMHGVDRYLREEAGPASTRSSLVEYYGTVPHTMYSLMMAISGGVDWHDMAEPLGTVHPIYQGLFAFYVLLIIIGVLNVLTSVFVQRANDLVRLDRDLVIQNQLVSNETFLREMKAIFDEVDHDGTGTITWEKFWEYMQHEEVQAYFVTQQLDTSDARELFNLLDVEHKAEVRIEDFIMGCMKLRGQARSSDVATLMRESKRVGQKTMRQMRKIDRQLGTICHHLVPPDASAASFWNVTSPVSRYGGSQTPASRYMGSTTPHKQHRL